jgi:hypothetical protein
MALTKAVSIVEVSDAGDKHRGKLYNIKYELIITDDGSGSGFTKKYSAQYKDVDGLTVTQQVNRVIAIVAPLMQKDIDKYKAEEAVRTHQKAIDSVATIDGLLEV